MHIKVSGDYAYITDGEPDSVYTVYVGDPTHIELAGHYSTGSSSYGIDADSNGNVYLASLGGGLIILKAEATNNNVISSFTNGNIGIGTSTPAARLHVAGLGGNDGLKFVSTLNSTVGYNDTPTEVSGGYLYARNGYGGVDIFDVSNPRHVVQAGRYTLNSGTAYDGPVVSGSIMYVPNNGNEIEVVDISNPRSPLYVRSYNSSGGPVEKMKIAGNYLYGLDDDSNIIVLDIGGENIADPQLASTLSSQASYFKGFTLAGSKLFANTNTGFEIYDISNPYSVQYVSTYASTFGSVYAISVVGDTAYLDTRDGISNIDKLEIVDVTNVNSPTYVTQYNSTTGALHGAIAKGHFVFAKNNYGSIEVIDVTDKAHPKYVTSFESSTHWYSEPFISGDYLYASNDAGKIESLDISNPKAPVAAVFTGGRVGVGTANPDAAFSVVGTGGDGMTSLGMYRSELSNISINPYVVGGYMYVINQTGQMEVVDVHDTAHPTRVSSYNNGNEYASGSTPIVSDGYAYLRISNGSIEIVDVRNPASPAYVTTVYGGGNPLVEFFVKNNIIYAADGAGQIEVFNVTDKNNITNPQNFASGKTIDSNSSIMVEGSYLYVHYDDGTLGVINVTDPSNLVDAVNLSTHTGDSLRGFGVLGTTLYLTDNNHHIDLFNNTNPSNPSYLATYTTTVASIPSISKYSSGENGNIYVASGDCAISTIDISTPDDPSEVDRHSIQHGDCIAAPFISNGRAYSITESGGIQIFDISGNAHPTSAATFSNGRVGISTTNPLATLDVNGSMVISGVGRYLNFGLGTGPAGYGFRDHEGTLQYKNNNGQWADLGSQLSTDNVVVRTLSTTNNDTVEIGHYVFTNGAGTIKASVTIPSYGYSVAKEYVFPVKYDQTSNEWKEVLPVSSTGDYGGNDFALDVSVTGNTAYLRLRTSGTVFDHVGTAHVVLSATSDGSEVFTETSNTANDASVTGMFASSAFTSVNGMVGIGTSTPTSALEVNGDIRISAGSNGRLYFGDGSSMFTASATGTGIESWNDLNFITGGQFSVQTGDGNSTSTKFIIKNDGTVGIGTDNPSAPLDVEAPVDGQTTMLVLASGFGFYDQGSTIAFRDTYVPGVDAATIKSVAYAPGAAGLVFSVGTLFGEEGTTEAMRITTGGEVGIGTSQPTDTLHIAANANNLLMLQSITGGGGNTANINFDTYEDLGSGIYPTSQISAIDDGSYSSSLAFSTKDPGSDTNSLLERMRILSTGYVGIATTTPTQALTVGGDIALSGDVCNQIVCLSDIMQPSDSRFKVNVSSIESGTASSSGVLENLMRLNPVTYNWNETYLKMNPHALDASTTKLGFIAQEVNNVYPEAVMHMPNGFLGIDYGKLTSVLTAGIQEIVRVSGLFRENLIAWLGSSANGVQKFFSAEVHTKKICVAKNDGTEVCVTGDELDKMVNPSTMTAATVSISNAGSTAASSTATTTTTIATSTATSTSVAATSSSSVTTTNVSSSSGDSTATSSVEYQGATTTQNTISGSVTGSSTDSTSPVTSSAATSATESVSVAGTASSAGDSADAGTSPATTAPDTAPTAATPAPAETASPAPTDTTPVPTN
ncbi:hypothetical protein EB052_00030 [bacterium]|nr:hypothetical protein [bacterium]